MSWRQTFLQWTSDDTARWLSVNGLGDYSVRFIEEEVTGRSLLGLTPALIAALIPKIGPQAEFNYILGELKNEGSRLERLQNPRLDHIPVRVVQRSQKTAAPVAIEIPDDIAHSNESQISISDDAREDDVTSPLRILNPITTSTNQITAHLLANQQPSTSTNPMPRYKQESLIGSDFTSLDERNEFFLSEIPEKLVQRLIQGDQMTLLNLQQGRSSEKNHIIRCVYGQLQKITLYPTGQQYRQAGHAIVSKFPLLRDDSKTGFENWAKSLKDRFKNQRRFMTDNPAVLERKINRQRQFQRTFGDAIGDSPSKLRRVEEPLEEDIEELKLFYNEPHDALNVQPDLELDTCTGDEDVEDKSDQ